MSKPLTATAPQATISPSLVDPQIVPDPGTMPPAVMEPHNQDQHRRESQERRERRERNMETGGRIMPIVPRDLDELARMADWIIASGMVPDSYVVDPTKQKPPVTPEKAEAMTKSRIMMGLQAGAEVGMAPLAAIRNIAIINNQPSVWGRGAIGLVQASGLVMEWEERFEGQEQVADPVSDEIGELDYAPTTRDFPDDYTAVCRIWRRGQPNPYVGKFSVRDARRTKLWNHLKKQPWTEHPKDMLMWRARSRAMGTGFSDALLGLPIREIVPDLTVEADELKDQAKDDGAFADQMAAAMRGGREVGALPAPSEQPMEITISQSKTPVAVENSTTTEPITVSRVTPPAEPSGPAVPIVEIFKPLGARAPNWKRTREALITSFQTLETTAECVLFRMKNSGTINQLREQAKSEWEIWQEVAGTHEYTLYEQEHPATESTAIADAEGSVSTT